MLLWPEKKPKTKPVNIIVLDWQYIEEKDLICIITKNYKGNTTDLYLSHKNNTWYLYPDNVRASPDYEALCNTLLHKVKPM